MERKGLARGQGALGDIRKRSWTKGESGSGIQAMLLECLSLQAGWGLNGASYPKRAHQFQGEEAFAGPLEEGAVVQGSRHWLCWGS